MGFYNSGKLSQQPTTASNVSFMMAVTRLTIKIDWVYE